MRTKEMITEDVLMFHEILPIRTLRNVMKNTEENVHANIGA